MCAACRTVTRRAVGRSSDTSHGEPAALSSRGVLDSPGFSHYGAFGELGRMPAPLAHEVEDLLALRQQVIGDYPSVTAPPDRFRAHHGRAQIPSMLAQALKADAEVVRESVVGV